MSDARRAIIQAGSSLVGLGLILFGAYMGLNHEGSWNVWGVAVVLGPIGFGLLLAFRQPMDRALDVLAPRVPFLHDHEESR